MERTFLIHYNCYDVVCWIFFYHSKYEKVKCSANAIRESNSEAAKSFKKEWTKTVNLALNQVSSSLDQILSKVFSLFLCSSYRIKEVFSPFLSASLDDIGL